ncbi:MAG: vitamin K epoxide reductase family protein [Candidatus Dormiibacterota bacterium]
MDHRDAALELRPSALQPSLARRAGAGAWTLAGLALVGLGISAYLTAVHYAGVGLICSSGGIVNCAAVTSSSYSLVPGTTVPITVPGMIWFVVSGGMAVTALMRDRADRVEPLWIRPAQAAWAALGLAACLYLVYAEVVVLHEICEWCTAIHLVVLITTVLTLARLAPPAGVTQPEPPGD